MGIILILMIVTILIISTVEKSNKTAEIATKMNLAKFSIDNIFYKTDTRFTKQLSYCSVQQLQISNLTETELEECFLIPDVIKNKNYSLSNDNAGEYKITYTFDYNKFSTNVNNKNKTVSDNNDGTITVTKNYNNSTITLDLLKEIASFFEGTYLTADSLGDSDETTFYSNVNNRYYSKESYSCNGVSIYDKNYPNNQEIYISQYTDDIMYVYDDTNKKITIFTISGLSESIVVQLEYLYKNLLSKYTVTNDDTTDGNGEIDKN